jgi:hypothetical protein
VYKALPAGWKQYWMYKSFVGEAMNMLKQGKTADETENILCLCYAAEFAGDYKEENEFIHSRRKHSRYKARETKYKRARYKTQDLVSEISLLYLTPCALNTCPRAGPGILPSWYVA